jgi:hypothetical protein
MEKIGDRSFVTVTPGSTEDQERGRSMNGRKTPENTTVSKESVLPPGDPVANPKEEPDEYISGFNLLFAIMFSIAIAGFLLLLDGSVISTVRWQAQYIYFQYYLLSTVTGRPENHGTISFP